MNNKALKTVEKYNMLSYGDSIVAAVSGGADSMALVCFLLELKQKLNLNITVCHINHLLRGSDADRDEDFVRGFCQKYSLPFQLLRCDVARLAKQQKIGFEECGRQIRYDFLNKTANAAGNNCKIATAHTLSDCGETLLFNIVRGCSISGLCSIAPVRDNIIRPLIECTRSDIEGYLVKKGQTYMSDSTNLDTAYRRNFLRHEIIPRLKKINPSFDLSVLNLTALCREQSDFLSRLAIERLAEIKKDGGILKNELNTLHPALKSSIILQFLRENNIEFSKKRCDEILKLLDCESGKLSVGKDLFIVLSDGVLKVLKHANTCDFADFEFAFCEGSFILGDGRQMKISKISKQSFLKIKKDFPELLKNCINYDVISKNFTIRNRREGDFISLYPRNVTKSLKKLFIESKIPSEKRNIIPIIADGKRAVWIEGVGIDRTVSISDVTENILFIEVF